MYEMTILAWIIIISGLITCLPLLVAQLVVLRDPHGKKARDILIGADENWRDNSHFKSALALAWADWILFAPLLILAIVGMLLEASWGYLLLVAAGSIQLYINIFLWFFEREYVYPANGPLKYYTYLWGNFMYWGTAAVVYGIIRLTGFAS